MPRDHASASYDDTGKLVLRVLLAVLLLFHGISKVINGPDAIIGLVTGAGLPAFFGYFVYVGEVIAPLLILLGIWTRVAAVLVAVNMVVAVLLVHTKEFFTLTENGGWAMELQAFYFGTAIAITFLGAGRTSVGGINGRWN